MNKIQSINSIPIRDLAETQKSKVAFGQNKFTETPDSFETEKIKKEKTRLEHAILAITGLSIAAVAVIRGKLGKALKLVGEDVPLTTIGRIKKLSGAASKDELTKLFNRKTLDADIEKEFNKARKNNQNLSVAMLDMDNFKGVNEVFNHDKGDLVLKRIAANIQEVAEKHGVKGFRYGGEEFVVTLPEKDPKAAQKIISEISEALKKDKEIQGLLPEFKSKAKEDLEFVTPRIGDIDSLFAILKMGDKIKDKKPTVETIISLIETHIQKFKPADTKNLDKVIAKLKSTSAEDLPNILKVDGEISEGVTLGKELDKLQSKYMEAKNDLEKWIRHANTYESFTVSGGVIHIKDASEIKDGKTLVHAADLALKSAKENGKNNITTANGDIIKKAIKDAEEEAKAKLKQ